MVPPLNKGLGAANSAYHCFDRVVLQTSVVFQPVQFFDTTQMLIHPISMMNVMNLDPKDFPSVQVIPKVCAFCSNLGFMVASIASYPVPVQDQVQVQVSIQVQASSQVKIQVSAQVPTSGPSPAPRFAAVCVLSTIIHSLGFTVKSAFLFQFLRAKLVAAVVLVTQLRNSALHPFIPICVNKGVIVVVVAAAVVVVAVVAVVFPPMVSHVQEGESKRVACDHQREGVRENFACTKTATTPFLDSASPRFRVSCTTSQDFARASSDPLQDSASHSKLIFSDTPQDFASHSSSISSDTPQDFAVRSSLISSASGLILISSNSGFKSSQGSPSPMFTSESCFPNCCCLGYLFQFGLCDSSIARKADSATIDDKLYTI